MNIYIGPNGGMFYIKNGVKIYVPRGPIPITHAGSLSELGYTVHKSERARRTALRKAIDLYGPVTTLRRVNALYVFNKNKHPDLAAIYHKDKDFIEKYIRY